jgi:hypothetical protein
MTTLMAAPTAAALPDVHPKASPDRSRLGKFILVLKLAADVLDLPATLTPWGQRRVELLIHHSRRLAVTVPAVIIPRPPTRPTPGRVRLPTRERRRLTLPRSPRLLQLPLKRPNPSVQPLVLPRQPNYLGPKLLILERQRRATRPQPTKLTGSASSTSTCDAVTATTATMIRRRQHNPCSAR